MVAAAYSLAGYMTDSSHLSSGGKGQGSGSSSSSSSSSTTLGDLLNWKKAEREDADNN